MRKPGLRLNEIIQNILPHFIYKPFYRTLSNIKYLLYEKEKFINYLFSKFCIKLESGHEDT